MRFANVGGRAALTTGEVWNSNDDPYRMFLVCFDLERLSRGRFGSDPQSLFDEWPDVAEFARSIEADLDEWDHDADPDPVVFVDELSELGPPVPRPRQVFGIGLNYRDHAAETGAAIPEIPATFTKFPTSITGPGATVELPSDKVDWEVELVVVIGTEAHRVDRRRGWDHVAGLMVGQDLSERDVQYGAGMQFCLGKSYPGFAPTGPWMVTPDDLVDRDDLPLRCSIDGEVMQDGRTSDMVFDVPALIAELSAVVILLPGDIIFTGTPPGVGVARNPPRFLRRGEVVTSSIGGIGEMTTRFA